MKVYTLPISNVFQPTYQSFRYPGHNDGYDVEQDFLVYMTEHPEMQATTLGRGDWAYLPIFWTRWHMDHDYAKGGLVELQEAVKTALDGVTRAFTVCHYDDSTVVDVGATVVFLAARKTPVGRDIPTLSAHHKRFRVEKRYKASFVGRLHTHTIRQEMARALAHRPDIVIQDGNYGEHAFVETLLASQIALCPRGYGGSSFRFYEAMQLGIVPLLIHDIDVRPFKHAIDWSTCSFYTPSADAVETLIDQFDEDTLREMGQHASKIFHECLDYQKWCPYVLQELERAS